MTAREKTYVTFTFQDREILLPSVFEASAAAMMSGNGLAILAELVPNHDELLAEMTITEFGDFLSAWTKASEAAQPGRTKGPTKSQRIYRHAWHVFWVVLAVAALMVVIASIFVDVPPELRYTLPALVLARFLHLYAAPDRTP